MQRLSQLLILFSVVFSPSVWASSMDERINNVFKPLEEFIVPIVFFKIPDTEIQGVVIWLALACLTFTVYFGFLQFRKLPLALDVIKGRFSKADDPGEVTAFQALSTALSGTVGLGNIAGVAVAISLGGPGAMVWMILMGFMGMAAKFVECTLGVKYRDIDANGKVAGGPMYYLSRGLADIGLPQFGKVMGAIAAFLIIIASFGAGNLFQANQATSQMMSLFGMTEGGYLFGIAFAVIVGMVIVGGIKSIAKVTSKLVPFMAVTYILAGLFVILMNISDVPAAIGTIISSAFSPEAGVGGIIGAMIQGFKRATFSSEAGFGTASIAHSAVKTREPTTEGLVGLLEPFIDTVVICSITALMIVVTGVYTVDGLEGVTMTAAAFDKNIPGFSVVLTVAVVLFAFSTMISWSYYGEIGWKYLFGDASTIIYKVIFCAVCVVGAAMNLGPAINLSDAGVFALAFFNVLGLYFLMPIVKREVNQFFNKVEKGEL